VPIATEVEIDSVRTASWIIGSNPFDGERGRLAGYIVRVASPKFVCKYIIDDNLSVFFWPESDDNRVAAVAFSIDLKNMPEIDFNTVTFFDLVWLDPEPEDKEARDKILRTTERVVEIFLLNEPAKKEALIQEYDGV